MTKNRHSGEGTPLGLASAIRIAIRRLVFPLVRVGNLDLRSARARLIGLGARHVELSAIVSVDDESAKASSRLLELVPRILERAAQIQLTSLYQRDTPPWLDTWPGEHYRLLAALVCELRARRVVEIGTFTGLSALAMMSAASRETRLTTFDIVAWTDLSTSHLRSSDFRNGRIVQELADLRDSEACALHARVLQEADLIFIDGPKDGSFEAALMRNFEALGLPRRPLLVFDDIRMWNMLSIWKEIARPKLDLTSFGHWTGTGLVDWTALPGHHS